MNSPSHEIKFEHLSVEQGLSHTTVKSIFQDRKGFMWFGTEDGLNKFDGYTFTVYRYDPDDSTTLSFNEILDIHEDYSGNLWIATCGGGLNRFDRKTETFVRYTHDRTNPYSLATDSLYCLTGYSFGDKEILWIGSVRGLCKFDPVTVQFSYFPHTDKGWPYSWIRSVAVDSAGKVWFGTMGGGLYRFDPETGQHTRFINDPHNSRSISSNGIPSLYWDRAGILWVGTKKGLNRYNPKTKMFSSYQMDINDHQALNENWIFSIHEDRYGMLWLGTSASGLNVFDQQTEQFTAYRHDLGNPNSISDNTVMCLCEDEAGILWVGTWEGINKIDLRKSQFKSIQPHPGDPNSLSGSFIWSLSASKESIWIGTKTDGLNKLDLNSSKIERYTYESSNPNSIPSDYIFSLCEDRSGILWIGTYGDGLVRYNLQSKTFYRYQHDPDNPYSIKGNIIFNIIEDSSGEVWIGTQGYGLQRLDKKTNRFTHFLPNTPVTNIYEDKSGHLWIAGIGLKKMNRTTEQVTSYYHNPEDSASLSGNSTTALYETTENGKQILWVGTYSSGLNRFDTEREEFKHYTIDNGLPSNTINAILEDNEANLWLSTNNGLSKFNPRSETFSNYDVTDGLLDNKFNVRAGCKTADGQLFFGSTRGLVSFYPEKLSYNLHIPEIVITDFQIYNKPVGIRKNKPILEKDAYLLEQHISHVHDMKLSYRESVFSFAFAALDYSAPGKNVYAYKMEGVDPEWVYTDASRRFATYTNLDPGEYTFRVRGSNNDGIWNERGTSIKIVITPPWWKTRPAYIFYLLFFIFLFVVAWRAQLRRIAIRQQLKMERFEAEKLREVDQLKSRFFANISHEFRTPLTLIKGPVKQIMEGTFAGNLKQQCQMILRNSDRLLGLINQILDLSKLESGEMTLQVAETDIIPYLKGMVLSFSPLAESKKTTLKFTSNVSTLPGYIDRDKLDKIVTNLLSNAFKFTPEGGEVEVSLRGSLRPTQSSSIKNEGIAALSRYSGIARNDKLPPLPSASPLVRGGNKGTVIISVTNTGPGIPATELDNIFDRFYQAENNYKKDGEGTGIGLALTRELVEACRGEITVTSIPDKTTTFKVTLPVFREYFKEDEISEETGERSAQPVEEHPPYSPTPEAGKPFTKGETDSSPLSSGITHVIAREERPKQSPHPPAGIEINTLPLLLIVEDNPDVAAYISSFMNKAYRIITAENGKEGLQTVLDQYPELIISDVMMPEMDGFEFCKKVKSDERISHIPVILLTAKADLDSKIEGLEFGADDYVTKPFEARELQIRARNLVEQRKKLRDKFSALIDLNPSDIAASSMDEQLLNRLLAIFEDHLEEPDFSIEQLAREIGMSRIHLNRKIQALTNLSTRDFIRTLRLQRAAKLLTNASGTVSEVAYRVGFNNLSYFSRAFRKHFGKLPSEFNGNE